MNFSIIICTYNSADSLLKTLDSVLFQTCDDHEVVIIDGSSSDGTLDVIKAYEERFAGKLRWISEKDAGIYDAMNKGIDLVKGDWLYFIGAGDVLANNDVLERILLKLNNYSCDVCYGNVQMGDEGMIYDGEFTSEKLIEKNISHQAIFYNKKVFSILGKYDTKYKTLADWEFNMRWINDKNIKSKYADLIVAKFELGGASKTFFDEKFYSDFEKNIKKYFPVDLYPVYEKNKKKEIYFSKSRAGWKIWKLKKKIEFAILHPIAFLKKYVKK